MYVSISPLSLCGHPRIAMQHPLTGATCVALPNVGMCPQLSCALTFMYLQQVRRAALSRWRQLLLSLARLGTASMGCALCVVGGGVGLGVLSIGTR